MSGSCPASDQNAREAARFSLRLSMTFGICSCLDHHLPKLSCRSAARVSDMIEVWFELILARLAHHRVFVSNETIPTLIGRAGSANSLSRAPTRFHARPTKT